SATTRAMASTPPPGGYGTTSVMVRVGYSSARASPETASGARAPLRRRATAATILAAVDMRRNLISRGLHKRMQTPSHRRAQRPSMRVAQINSLRDALVDRSLVLQACDFVLHQQLATF